MQQLAWEAAVAPVWDAALGPSLCLSSCFVINGHVTNHTHHQLGHVCVHVYAFIHSPAAIICSCAVMFPNGSVCVQARWEGIWRNMKG